MMAIGREHRWVGLQHIRSKTPLGPASQLKISGRASPSDQKTTNSGPKCARSTHLRQSAKSYNSFHINELTHLSKIGVDASLLPRRIRLPADAGNEVSKPSQPVH